MEKLSYAKCSKNQVPDEYSDNVQWKMSLRKGKKLRLRRSKTENLLNLIGFNLDEATPAINVQQKTLCRSKTTTNHDHFASGARSDENNNLTFLV